MGIYDRPYYKEDRPLGGFRGPQTAVGALILLNVGIYLADQIFGLELARYLAVRVQSLVQPWLWWQFLTYGFLHTSAPSHILFNMLGLWFFGREIESVYGRNEFFRLYLVLLAVGAMIWAGVSRLQGVEMSGPLVGASGAVAGIVVLYALHFPHRTVLLMFVLPVPAWVLGVLLVAGDAMGALSWSQNAGPGPQVAYTVHLAGAAFAFLYYRLGWNFGWLGAWSNLWTRLTSSPRLKLHSPEDSEEEDDLDDVLTTKVDRILEKIQLYGADSLTPSERRTLENASRRFRAKHQRRN